MALDVAPIGADQSNRSETQGENREVKLKEADFKNPDTGCGRRTGPRGLNREFFQFRILPVHAFAIVAIHVVRLEILRLLIHAPGQIQ